MAKNGKKTISESTLIPSEELKKEIAKHMRLIGKKVRYKGENPLNPYCDLIGVVRQIEYSPGKTIQGEYSDFWAEVEWDVIVEEDSDDDEFDDFSPADEDEITNIVPIDRIEIVIDDKKGYA